jgi:hypothetical protein
MVFVLTIKIYYTHSEDMMTREKCSRTSWYGCFILRRLRGLTLRRDDVILTVCAHVDDRLLFDIR